MSEQNGERFWRIRMRYIPEEVHNDYSERAWNLRQVGIWYGAWSAEDFEVAKDQSKPQDYLNGIPAQQQLIEKFGVKGKVGPSEIHTIKRFFTMSDNDWVVACFGNAIHIGRVVGKPESNSGNDDFNRPYPEADGIRELWKFVRITDTKSFPLSALPDFYRLIPQAGRGNVHQLLGNNRLSLEFLATCRNADDVVKQFDKMNVDERLDFLGPKAWESFCLGYLILEKHFVPTGLAVGGTLKDLDIVGRHKNEGHQILAQCKKNQDPIEVEEGFLTATEGLQQRAEIFYCAYGGCNKHPSHVEVIDRDIMKQWVESGRGRKYLDSFFNMNR